MVSLDFDSHFLKSDCHLLCLLAFSVSSFFGKLSHNLLIFLFISVNKTLNKQVSLYSYGNVLH